MGRGDEMNGTRDYLRELLTILFIQKRLIAAVTLLFLTGAILIAFLWPPSYASSGSIFIKNNRTIKTPEELENVNWEVTTVQETDLYSEIGILTSEELIKKTVERLAQEEGLFPDQVKDPLSLQRLIRRIQKSMSAELLPRSTIFKVTLVWHDPARAQKLLTALMEDYLLFRGQIHSPPEALPFFKEQLAHFNDQLVRDEEELLRLASSFQAVDPAKQISANLDNIKDLQTQMASLRSQIEAKRGELNVLQKVLDSGQMSFFSFTNNLQLSNLGGKLQDMVLKRQELLQYYAPSSPKVRNLDAQIRDTAEIVRGEALRYLESQRAELQGQEAALARMEERMNRLMQQNVALYEASIRSKQIQRRLGVLEESYQTYARRMEEARIKNTTDADQIFTVSILSHPTLNPSPVFPQKPKVVALGLVLGLVVGATLGFIREFFDHTFKRPEDVRGYTGLKTIFSLPQW
jgi:uncharacterized protein involved in exopolysaccharide biosynthesis